MKICNKCGFKPVETFVQNGKRYLRKVCQPCRKVKIKYGVNYKKKTYCENRLCENLIVHTCQLDIDHIDAKRRNEPDITNLQTLCANCHRLKTMINKDSLKKENTGEK